DKRMLSRLSPASWRENAGVRCCGWLFLWCRPAGKAMQLVWAVLALAMALAAVTGPARAQDEFLDPAEAFVLAAAMQNPTELHVHFRIAPDYYMYRERFSFELDAPVAGEPIYPRGLVKYDPTFDEDMEAYHTQVTIRLPLQSGSTQPAPFRSTGQGCANAGLCYPPMTFALQLVPVDQGYLVQGEGVVQSVPPPQDELAVQIAASAGAQGGDGAGGVLSLGDTELA